MKLAPRGTSRTCLIAACLLCAGSPTKANSQSEQLHGYFQETSCDLPHLSPEIALRTRCGTVEVPKVYSHSKGGSFKLAVVLVHSSRQPAQPDPVVFINGGPGSPLIAYTDYQAQHPYADDRDLILVDQRGIGRSEPTLCPVAADQLLQADLALAATPTTEMQARRRGVFMTCRKEATARGIDLDGFGTASTAEDFDMVRGALGIVRWNVVGESYGTTVAMTLMARHPGTIRSAVLDSVYPPDPLPPWSARVASARGAYFAMCAEEAACSVRYPNLARLYRQVVDHLAESPSPLAVPPAMHQPGNQMLLTASLFEVTMAHLLYYPDNYPGLPRLIADVRRGDTASFAAALARVFAAGRALNIPAYVSVECRDRPHYRDPVDNDAGVLERSEGLFDVCAAWSDPGQPPVIPAGTEIPTLVLAGQFDPNASPALSRQLAELIGQHAHWIEFAAIGHNVRHFSPCASAIVAAFISTPEEKVDASCAQHPRPIQIQP